VYFRSDKYAPDSTEGATLLAHELTHTLQQTRGVHAQMSNTFSMSSPGDPSEQEAESMAQRAVSGPLPQPGSVTSVPAQLQGDWLDDAGNALGNAYDATSSAVSSTYNTVATAAGNAYDAASGAVSKAYDSTSEAVGNVATAASNTAKNAVASVSAAVKTVAASPQKAKEDLLAKVTAMRLRFEKADPDSIHATDSKLTTLNSHISQINALGTTAAIPLVLPTAGPAIGSGVIKALTAIGEAIGGIEIATIIVGLLPWLLLLLLFGALLSSDTPVADEKGKEEESEEDKRKKKEKEEEQERDKEKKKEKEKEEEDEKDKRLNTPLKWNPFTTVKNAVASGGVVGALELGEGVPSPPTGLQYDAHHVWPKFAGGPEKQPLMGIFSFVHLSLMHPLMLNPLLTRTFSITTRTTDPLNVAFIARLRTDAAKRAQVAAVLTGFYLALNTQTSPPIPPEAYQRGISSAFVDIPFT